MHYSDLSATMGSSLAAREAGYQPLSHAHGARDAHGQQHIERSDAQGDAEGGGQDGSEGGAQRHPDGAAQPRP